MNAEKLQLAWDRWLVTCFYKYAFMPMPKVVSIFMQENKDEVFGFTVTEVGDVLLRFPQLPHHWKPNLSRFVCAYLPTIANTLWKYDVSRVEDLTKAVNKLKSTTRREPEDVAKVKEESRARKKTKRDARKALMEKILVKNVYDRHKASNQWDKVK